MEQKLESIKIDPPNVPPRPSSKSVADAIVLLQAIGSDKKKDEILQRIKKAQESSEKTLGQANAAKAQAEKCALEAIELEKTAFRKESEIQQLEKEMLHEKARLADEKQAVIGREKDLQAKIKTFDIRMKNSLAELAKKKEGIDRREAICSRDERDFADQKTLLSNQVSQLTELYQKTKMLIDSLNKTLKT